MKSEYKRKIYGGHFMLMLKGTWRWIGIRRVVSGLCGSAMIALGQVAPARPELPSIDRRDKGTELSPAQQNGLAQLRTRTPAIRVDTDRVLGSPAWVMSTQGFLSGPPALEIARQGSLGQGIPPTIILICPAQMEGRIRTARRGAYSILLST